MKINVSNIKFEGENYIEKLSLNYDFKTVEKQRYTVKNVMTNRLFAAKSFKTKKRISVDEDDFDAIKLERRIKAVNNELNNLSKHLNIKETNYVNKKQMFLFFNSLTHKTYHHWENDSSATIASAIWMLDSIKKNGNYDKAKTLLKDIKYIPKDDEWRDAEHDTSLIYQMEEVIRKRNNDEDIWTSLKKEDSPEKQLYNELLALCSEEDIQHAVSEFKKTMADCITAFSNYSQDSFKKYSQELKNTKLAWDEFKNKVNQLSLMNKPALSSTLRTVVTPDTSALDMCNQIIRLENRLIHITNRATDFMMIDGMVKKEDYEPLVINNPYNILFATQYLLDNNSDLTWCYFPSVLLFGMATMLLPWSNYGADEDAKVECKTENIYAVKYQDITHMLNRANKAQLMYNATGVLPPRQYAEDENNTLFDISEEDRFNLTLLKGYTKKLFENVSLEKEDKPQELIDLQNEYNTAKRTIKNLEISQNQLASTQEKLLEENKNLQKEIDSQLKELAELRKVVFEIESHTEIDEDKTIEYPYSFEKKIVVYGGHDKWLKHMNNLTEGNISIVGPDIKIDKKLIHNADLLVIQINCISHPFYWRAIDAAKSENTPILLLYQDSPRICIQRIIERCEKL